MASHKGLGVLIFLGLLGGVGYAYAAKGGGRGGELVEVEAGKTYFVRLTSPKTREPLTAQKAQEIIEQNNLQDVVQVESVTDDGKAVKMSLYVTSPAGETVQLGRQFCLHDVCIVIDEVREVAGPPALAQTPERGDWTLELRFGNDSGGGWIVEIMGRPLPSETLASVRRNVLQMADVKNVRTVGNLIAFDAAIDDPVTLRKGQILGGTNFTLEGVRILQMFGSAEWSMGEG